MVDVVVIVIKIFPIIAQCYQVTIYSYSMTKDNICRLDVHLPPGIYFVFNPQQESHGAIAQLLGGCCAKAQ